MSISLVHGLEILTSVTEIVAIVFIRLAFRELQKANKSHQESNTELAEINAKLRERAKLNKGARPWGTTGEH